MSKLEHTVRRLTWIFKLTANIELVLSPTKPPLSTHNSNISSRKSNDKNNSRISNSNINNVTLTD
jgi:hypothetical protein